MNSILAALVNGMFVGVALALAVWLALRLMPRNSMNAATRYAVWWAALLVIAGLPFLYLRTGGATSAGRSGVNAISIQAEAPHTRRAGESGPPIPSATNSATIRPAMRPSIRPTLPVTLPPGPWPARILFVWLLASISMLIRLGASIVMLERRKARASAVPATLAAQVTQWVAHCGGSNRRIRLASSGGITIPLVTGPWRPTILLPLCLPDQLSESDLEQIGIHEAAHLVRCDDWALLIQRLLQAVFALHPVVHWVSSRIDLEREIACDDFVIAATGNPKPYAACLARVVERAGGVRALPVAAAAAEGRSHLARRVEILLDGTRNTTTHLLGLRLVAAVFGIAALAWGASQTHGVLAFAQPRPEPAIARLPDTNPAPARPQTPLIAQAQPPDSRQRAPIHSDVRLVPLNVTVTDTAGNPVTNLQQSDFQVFENNVAQPISIFSREEVPVSIGLVIDNSGSMRGKRAVAEAAVLALVKDSNPQNEFFVIDFNDEAWLDVDFTSDLKVLQAGLERTDARGGTATRDAIQMSIDHLRDKAKSPRKAIIVITDGNDNSSAVAMDRLVSEAQQEGTLVCAIGLPNDEDRSEAAKAKAAMNLLTGSTGCESFYPRDASQAEAIASQVAHEIRNQYYSIWYTPLNDALDGTYRSIRVTVTAPGNLAARTRLGYWATDSRKPVAEGDKKR